MFVGLEALNNTYMKLFIIVADATNVIQHKENECYNTGPSSDDQN